jgi:hypothetical protein
VGVADTLPYLPLDDRFNEGKTFGFVGNEITAALSKVTASAFPHYCPLP